MISSVTPQLRRRVGLVSSVRFKRALDRAEARAMLGGPDELPEVYLSRVVDLASEDGRDELFVTSVPPSRWFDPEGEDHPSFTVRDDDALVAHVTRVPCRMGMDELFGHIARMAERMSVGHDEDDGQPV